jgi:hypothetical protein
MGLSDDAPAVPLALWSQTCNTRRTGAMEVSALLGEHWRPRVAIGRQLPPEISCTKGVNYVCDEKY